MLKSNKKFIWDFIAILFELEKYAFFKIAFLGQECSLCSKYFI